MILLTFCNGKIIQLFNTELQYQNTLSQEHIYNGNSFSTLSQTYFFNVGLLPVVTQGTTSGYVREKRQSPGTSIRYVTYKLIKVGQKQLIKK